MASGSINGRNAPEGSAASDRIAGSFVMERR